MKIRFAASDRQSSAGMNELRERFEGLSIFRSLADSHRPIESFRDHIWRRDFLTRLLLLLVLPEFKWWSDMGRI